MGGPYQTALDRLAAPVRAAIDEGLAHGGPVVFDADGTLWRGDVGEDFLRYAAATGLLPGARERVYEHYEALLAKDHATAYAWTVQVMAGLEEATLVPLCRRFFAERFAGRLFPWVRPLFERLAAQRREVWICSASPRWPVEAGAASLGVGADRVIAVDCELEDGRLTGKVKQPVTCGAGKVVWLERKGVKAALAFGNGELDVDMLATAHRAVVVGTPDGPDNQLVRGAKTRGWPVLRC